MKSFLRILPFVVVFLVVFALQTKWATDDQVLPFLNPYGRASHAGATSINRPPLVLGQNRFAWLGSQDLVIATIDPASQKVSEEHRPLPNVDVQSHTEFYLAGDDFFWIGDNDVLKRATWQQGEWSATQTIAQHADSLYATQAGNQKLLLAGLTGALKVWSVNTDAVKELRSYPTKSVRELNGTVDAQGNLHVGAVDELGGALDNLLYLTVDTHKMQPSDAKLVRNISLPTSTSIYDDSFGVDRTHGYFLMTFSNSQSASKSMSVLAFDLNHPSASTTVSYPGQDPGLYSPYAEPGQTDSLTFVAGGGFAKNPRVQGNEVYFSTLQDGVWQPKLTRVSNNHGAAANPVFSRQGSDTTVLFMLASNYDAYDLYYNSDNKAYAAATNVITQADYVNSAEQVPQYMGIAALIWIMAISWPVLSFIYLIVFVMKWEDSLYDHAERHLLVGIVLNFLTQVVVFLNYAKLDNFRIYSPVWLHSSGAITLLFLAFTVVAYLFTKIYSKLRYERHAIAEFGYFFAINVWTALLGLSYFMAS